MRFPGFQEYEQALLLLEHNRNPFRSEAVRLIPCPRLEPGKKFKHDAVGQFAIVYKIRSNGRTWALRCPKAAFPQDVRERCRRVSETLPKSSPPYLLETTYVEPGISAGGIEVPIMLMEWADGENLRDRVEALSRAGDTRGLNVISDQFNRLCHAMDRDRFAHGDLSHGNLLVRRDGSLVLVDYDTVYREGDPAGRRSLAGTPGYVHPFPSEVLMQESLEMDIIPRKVIKLALDTYTSRPGLFGRFSSETLLFDQDDLEDPARSPKFAEVRRQVPSLSADLDGIANLLSTWRGTQPTPVRTHPSQLASPSGGTAHIPYVPGETVQPSVVMERRVPYQPGSTVSNSTVAGPKEPKYNPGETLK